MTAPESVAEAREVDVEVQAETYRHMHEIATQELGYPSILEALEACPPAGTPVPTAAHYAALKEERDRLREGLRRYGNHSQLCASRGQYVYTDARTRHRQPCNCGYLAALEQSK